MTRYRVSDLPVVGVGAFMPLPTLSAPSSSWGVVRRTGAPGDVVQPQPSPDGLPSLTARAPGTVDTAQGRGVAPDAWAPSVYVAYNDNMGPADDAGLGMTRRRFCELPVPAQNPTRIPSNDGVAQPARIGGRGQVPWPRAFQRFPNFGG